MSRRQTKRLLFAQRGRELFSIPEVAESQDQTNQLGPENENLGFYAYNDPYKDIEVFPGGKVLPKSLDELENKYYLSPPKRDSLHKSQVLPSDDVKRDSPFMMSQGQPQILSKALKIKEKQRKKKIQEYFMKDEEQEA